MLIKIIVIIILINKIVSKRENNCKFHIFIKNSCVDKAKATELKGVVSILRMH